MADDDDGMDKADIIMAGDYFALPGRRAHQLRLSMNVPEDAAPGAYRGIIRFLGREMFGGETEICSLEFEVVVHKAVLPGINEKTFHLDLWQHLSNIARKHETPLFSDAHFRVVARYVQSLAELGQKAVTVIASEVPWSGQRCFNDRENMADLFEYSMARVAKKADGSYAYDWAVMERYVELCFAAGIDREIEIFGLAGIWTDEERGWGKAAPDWPDGIRVRYYDEAGGAFRYMEKSEDIAGYIAALQDFLERKGWLGKALVVADEPADIEKYRLSLNAIRAAAPKLRFKTAINHAGFIDEFKDVVADYVPILPAVSAEWAALERARGKISGRLLYYVCCWPPYPNNFICSPLAEGRLIPLLAAYLKMDGFLRWNYTVWPENPRERLAYRSGEWWSGDMCFVYPSRGGEPLLSLRYFALKRGIEDFELLQMASAKQNGAREGSPKGARENSQEWAQESSQEGSQAVGKVWETILRQKDISLWEYEMGADTSAMFSSDWEDYERARLLLLEALDD
jgi:hypothetical protein